MTVADHRITIAAGDQEIGAWSLDEVVLEPTSESVFRLEVEGDKILIDLEDAASFRDVLDSTSRMRRRPKVRAKKPKKAAEAKTEPVRTATVRETKVEEKAEKPETTFLMRLDAILEKAENRWGSLLPSWVFTRATVVALLAVVIGAAVVPGIVSWILVLGGLLTVLLGAVVYTDTMLATRWLPGRMTPMHVLLFGVTFVMLGVLLGVVA